MFVTSYLPKDNIKESLVIIITKIITIIENNDQQKEMSMKIVKKTKNKTHTCININ